METEDLLANPIWNALRTDHAHLALGNEWARRYPPQIGPLSGMPAQSDPCYEALAPLAGAQGVVALFLQAPPRPPAGWSLVRGGTVNQMVAARPLTTRDELPKDAELRELTVEDAPAMVELAELTEPGPFRLGTIELGGYYGVVREGRLLAMAGKRMHLPGFVEVSAVCTHPEARGRGYARMLMGRVIGEILDAGRTPFLHVFGGNDGAIALYERLGFVRSRTFALAVVRREG